jgi:EipB-like
MISLRAIGCALVAALAVSAAHAGAIDILPHRAFYQMTLDRTATRSDVADVDGMMMFEWSDSCDGWSVTQKLAMTVYYATGESSSFAWSLNSWESKDGLKYRFFVRRTQDGREQAPVRGTAELEGAGKAGVAHYTEPKPKNVKLPAGTLFPTAHTIAVLDRAENGSKLMWADVFDGSDEEGLFGVGAIIGPRLGETAEKGDAAPLLKGVPSWHLGLAFFPNGNPNPEPEHEQTLQLYRNGVAGDLVLNYGDFSVSTTLKKLERLPAAGC